MNNEDGYNGQENTRVRIIRRYYLRGPCRFGKRLRNVHEVPTKTEKLINLEKSEQIRSVGTSQPNVASSFRQNASIIRCDLSSPNGTLSEETLELVKEACNHCCCFACINKWLGSKMFSLHKMCPESRRPSEYAFRSRFWQKRKRIRLSDMKSLVCKTKIVNILKGVSVAVRSELRVYTCMLRRRYNNGCGPPKPRRK